MAGQLGDILRRLLRDLPDGSPDREPIARFVLQCVFAMFAEDSELIPKAMFSRTLESAWHGAGMAPIRALFEDFARPDHEVKRNKFAPFVDGTLFDHSVQEVEIPAEHLEALFHAATAYDWQDMRPEVFGSIFERSLEDVERHEIGAHFTREEDILRIVFPSVVEPWRARIGAIRSTKDAQRVIDQMRAFHVLDPACGCGNFLYVAYREMKRLEMALKKAWDRACRKVAKKKADLVPAPPGPYFTIEQLHGIEIQPFAANLARVVLWIGEYLARRELGLDEETLPLKNLDRNVVDGDALFLDWARPEGELAIVGNPPFLGVRRMRAEWGDERVERMFEAYPENRAADLVTYWYTRALGTLRPGEHAGFVSTNSITQNESREASLDRIVAAGGTLLDAWRSYEWRGDAAVHVSIVNWIMGRWEGERRLDGKPAMSITPALTDGVDVTGAKPIPANRNLSFMGVTPGNKEFFLDAGQRAAILADDPGSEAVIRPFLIGEDLNRDPEQRPRRWIVDFGTMEKAEAERYRGAFQWVQRHVYPIRRENRREARARLWWRFAEAEPNLRAALAGLPRCVVLARITRDLMPCWASAGWCLDAQLFVFAFPHWYPLGILQSRIHRTWAEQRCSTLKDWLRYTGTTIFETFPFPPLPDGYYEPRVVPATPEGARVSAAAEAFHGARASVCRERGLGLTKVHNLLADGKLPELHALRDALDDAVCAAYGWPEGTWRDEEATLRRLMELNRKLA